MIALPQKNCEERISGVMRIWDSIILIVFWLIPKQQRLLTTKDYFQLFTFKSFSPLKRPLPPTPFPFLIVPSPNFPISFSPLPHTFPLSHSLFVFPIFAAGLKVGMSLCTNKCIAVEPKLKVQLNLHLSRICFQIPIHIDIKFHSTSVSHLK